MRRRAVLIFLFISIICKAQSPRQVVTRYLVWGGVFAQYNFTPKTTVHLDLQARNEITDSDWFNWLIRTGISFKTKNGIQLTAGIAYFKLYPNPNVRPPRPEWRPWQEIGKKFIAGHHTYYPRFRLEQRLVREYVAQDFDDHFSFSVLRWRFRFDYAYSFQPADQKGFLLLAGYEYLFNTNPAGKFNFDQNRAAAGVGYKFNSYFTLQLMYLNLFLRRSSNSFEQHHIARFSLVFQFERSQKLKSVKE